MDGVSSRLKVHLGYETLHTRTFADVLEGFDNLALYSAKVASDQLKLALPRMDVSAVHTGSSVKFTFKNGAPLFRVKDNDIWIRVPNKAVQATLVVGWAVIVGAATIGGAASSMLLLKASLIEGQSAVVQRLPAEHRAQLALMGADLVKKAATGGILSFKVDEIELMQPPSVESAATAEPSAVR